jgi:hypothetical protein
MKQVGFGMLLVQANYKDLAPHCVQMMEVYTSGLGNQDRQCAVSYIALGNLMQERGK